MKLTYGGMPPLAITVMYVAAKGTSLSKEVALSFALDIGIIMNTIITKIGAGTRKINGINWVTYKSTIATIDTGKVRNATKNIKET
ncbi:MAG: hypothetical protein QXM22_01920 [Candidatus Bathyarchaeia archaeon]